MDTYQECLIEENRRLRDQLRLACACPMCTHHRKQADDYRDKLITAWGQLRALKEQLAAVSLHLKEISKSIDGGTPPA